MNELEKDTYNTILTSPEPVLYKDKNSKFYGYAFPVTEEEEIKLHIEELKKRTPLSKTLVLCIPNWYRKYNL